MSNGLAVAAVTSTLRYLIDQALAAPHPGQVGAARVTTLRPDRLVDADTVGAPAGVNLFLYQVTPNHAWNLTDLPTRRADGSFDRRPVAALDLHYLLTCFGADPSLDAERLLGRSLVALAVTPVLSRDLVRAAMDAYSGDNDTAFLAASDLADQIELVKLSPAVLPLEDLSRLWGTFGSVPYRLSLVYSASVVLLEAAIVPRPALPVRQPLVTMLPSARPRLDELVAEPAGAPVTAGTRLELRGAGLLGPVTVIRVGRAELLPESGATPQALHLRVSETVPAGLHAVQVLHRARPEPGAAPSRVVAASASLPLTVRPQVAVAAVHPDVVDVTVTPAVRAGQRATLTLARRAGEPGSEALTVSLPAPASGEPPQDTFAVPRAALANGTWLLRIDVDGVESLPEPDTDGVYLERSLVLS